MVSESHDSPAEDNAHDMSVTGVARRIEGARNDLQLFSGSEGYENFRNYIDETERLARLLPATSEEVRKRLAHLDTELGEALGGACDFD